MSLSTTSSTEDKALNLLGQGFSSDLVASATGVSPSRISQLLSDPVFSAQVTEQRYRSLAKHSERDQRADSLEDKLLDKLEHAIPMVFDPMKLALIYSKVNAAKRRGTSSPEHLQTQQPTLQLTIPTRIVNKYTVNIHNQIISAGNTDLVTIQSARMNDLLASATSQTIPTSQHSQDVKVIENGVQNVSPAIEERTSRIGTS